MTTIKARKQRKNLYNAPMHKRRRWMSSHLEEKLLLKYDRRSIPVVKGDTVKIMRGSFKGHENKVSRVNLSKRYVEIEGVTMIKADGKKIAKPIHPSNLLITKLNLTDKWRRKKIEQRLSEEAKKEIEKEADEQIKEMKLEKKETEETKEILEEGIDKTKSKEEETTDEEKKPQSTQSIESSLKEKKPEKTAKTAEIKEKNVARKKSGKKTSDTPKKMKKEDKK